MNTLELWTRNTDRKILAGITGPGCVAAAAAFGLMLPIPLSCRWLSPVGALLGAALLVFFWSTFQLIRPVRQTRSWAIAELVAVPLAWLLMMVVLGLWFHQVGNMEMFDVVWL